MSGTVRVDFNLSTGIAQSRVFVSIKAARKHAIKVLAGLGFADGGDARVTGFHDKLPEHGDGFVFVKHYRESLVLEEHPVDDAAGFESGFFEHPAEA